MSIVPNVMVIPVKTQGKSTILAGFLLFVENDNDLYSLSISLDIKILLNNFLLKLHINLFNYYHGSLYNCYLFV